MSSGQSLVKRRAGLAIGIVVVGALLLWLLVWPHRPPQMGADEDVFANVDALFTALTARDKKLLAGCEQRLKASLAAERLPATASSYLDDIIAMAHDGRWEVAAERLYAFIRAQRREGAEDQPAQKRSKERNSAGRK